MFSIFLAKRLGKFSLSFKMSSTFRADACAYGCLFLDLVDLFAVLPFLKNFGFSKTFLGGLVKIKEEV